MQRAAGLAETQLVLGPLAFSRQTEALLRAVSMFIDTAPWRQFNAYEPLDVTFGGDSPVTRVVAVCGSGTLALSATLAAVTSLATGRDVGPAVVGELEAIVVPCATQPSQRN